MPPSGQANTVQGELLRAVEKLRDESQRNGNANWDHDFDALHAYVCDKLCDAAVFSTQVIEMTRLMLSSVGQPDAPYLDDDAYDQLADRVVEYFRFHGSRPYKHNPDLKR